MWMDHGPHHPGKLICFRFLGGFHRQAYDVTGISSSRATGVNGPPLGCNCNITGVIATRACSKAETCVQLADDLKNVMGCKSSHYLVQEVSSHGRFLASWKASSVNERDKKVDAGYLF